MPFEEMPDVSGELKPEDPKSHLDPEATVGADASGKGRQRRELTEDLADRIAKGQFKIPQDLPGVPAELHPAIADKFIDLGDVTAVMSHLDDFDLLDFGIAVKLIHAQGAESVASHINKFPPSEHQDIAMELISYGEMHALFGELSRFYGLDFQEIAAMLVMSNRMDYMALFLEKFREIDYDYVFDRVLRWSRDLYGVLQHLDLLDHDRLKRLSPDIKASFFTICLERGNFSLADHLADLLGHDVPSGHPSAIFFDMSVQKSVRLAKETYRPDDLENYPLPEEQRARLTHGMSPYEYQEVENWRKRQGLEGPPPATFEATYAGLLESYYRDEDGELTSVGRSMQTFGDLFGPKAAIAFANRPDLTRHDAYLAAHELTEFLETNKNPEDAEGSLARRFAKVLSEVAMDDAAYGHGTAHHRFNEVLRTLASADRIEEILRKAEELDLPGLTARVAHLREDRFNPLGSWKGLKDVFDVVAFLEKRDVIEALRSPNLPMAVKTYVEAMIAHPNIDIRKLSLFIADPKAFLDGPASHVEKELQKAVSPARILEVERLGLTADDMRDALVDGTLDRLQEIPADEARYLFDAYGNDLRTQAGLLQALNRAIGRQKEGIPGEAKDARKLFAALVRWGNNVNLSKDEILQWMRGERQLPDEVNTQELLLILHNENFGVIPERPEVRVRIGRKSDPSMAVAGDDTSSCMPFGDGKANVYAWGPSFAQLVVERKTSDGAWRTMAQAVLTVDFDAGRPAHELLTGLREGTPIGTLVGSQAFIGLPRLVCDNLEPAPNDIQAGRGPLIEETVKRFFHDYLQRHGSDLNVDPSCVMIGREDYLERDRWSFPQVDNPFVPLAPLSYTDNAGMRSYRIETGLQAEPRAMREGVSTVKATDIMPMAFLESKNYADNPDLVFGLYDRQHKIVGASIAAEKHGDPKLSLISRDANGTPVGYMIAYMDRTTDVPEVYIDDMAVDRSRNVLAAKHAIKLLDEFLGRYADHYRTSGQPFPPISAQMRETTSYRLLTRQAETFSKKFGLAIEVVEEGETSLGGETFKLVRIFVGSDAASLEASKTAFAERKPIARNSVRR